MTITTGYTKNLTDPPTFNWSTHLDEFRKTQASLRKAIQDFWSGGCGPPGGWAGGLFKRAIQLAFKTSPPTIGAVRALHQVQANLASGPSLNPWVVTAVVVGGVIIVASGGTAAPLVFAAA